MGVRHTSCSSIEIHIKNIHFSPSSLQTAASLPLPLSITSLSILTWSIIHHPYIRHQSFQTLLELPMRRVLLDIILPVLLARKLHHERVRVTCLLARQPAAELYAMHTPMPRNLHHPAALQKKEKEHTTCVGGKKKRNSNRNKE